MPAGFHRLPDLTRSALDAGPFRRARKLPLLADLVARAVDAADIFGAETIIYTNVDIAPTLDFHAAVGALLDQGFDAFTITRRTLAKDWPGGAADLPLMRAQLGEPHPGRDCFVFGREAARRYDLGLTCIGAPAVGKTLAANLLCHASGLRGLQGFAPDVPPRRGTAPWQAPELADYTEHNRRELLAVLGRLRAAGRGSPHPAWTKLVGRLAAPPSFSQP